LSFRPAFNSCASVQKRGYCVAYFTDPREAMRYLMWLRQSLHKCANGDEPDMIRGEDRNDPVHGWVTAVTY
jgi:hypothetical protein